MIDDDDDDEAIVPHGPQRRASRVAVEVPLPAARKRSQDQCLQDPPQTATHSDLSAALSAAHGHMVTF